MTVRAERAISTCASKTSTARHPGLACTKYTRARRRIPVNYFVQFHALPARSEPMMRVTLATRRMRCRIPDVYFQLPSFAITSSSSCTIALPPWYFHAVRSPVRSGPAVRPFSPQVAAIGNCTVYARHRVVVRMPPPPPPRAKTVRESRTS